MCRPDINTIALGCDAEKNNLQQTTADNNVDRTVFQTEPHRTITFFNMYIFFELMQQQLVISNRLPPAAAIFILVAALQFLGWRYSI